MTQQSALRGKIDQLRFLATALAFTAGFVRVMTDTEFFSRSLLVGVFMLLISCLEIVLSTVLFLAPWRYDETGAYEIGREAKGRTTYLSGAVLIAAAIGLDFYGRYILRGVTFSPLSYLPLALEACLLVCLVLLLQRRG